MKILKVAFLNVYQNLEGGEIYLERLINNLEPFLSEGAIVLSPFKLNVNISWIKIKGVTRTQNPIFIKQYRELIKTINKIVTEEKINIIILNGERAIYLAPFLRSSLIKIGVKHMLVESRNRLIKSLLFRFCIRRINSIVTISKFHIEHLTELLGPKYSERLHLIYNSVNEKEFVDNKSVKREVFVFLEAASLSYRKGQIDLIKAFYQVQKEYKKAKLILAGTGVIEKQIKELINQYSLNENVVLAGFVKDVVTLIQKCDVFVLPSYSEGLPLSILEAMSCSRPVIATNIAGTPEIVHDMENGFIINPGDIGMLTDRMICCIENRELCVKFGKKSREIIEKDFTETRFVQKWTELLSDISENKKNFD